VTRKPGKIEAAQIEEAERQLLEPDSEAHVGELLAGGRWRGLRRWFSRGIDLWTPRLERLGKWIAALALVVGGLVKLVHDFRSTSVGPAELPKGGGERTFVDRVDKPTPPGP
jgi:hypothetical protein